MLPLHVLLLPFIVLLQNKHTTLAENDENLISAQPPNKCPFMVLEIAFCFFFFQGQMSAYRGRGVLGIFYSEREFNLENLLERK